MKFVDVLMEDIDKLLTWETAQPYAVALLILVFGFLVAKLVARAIERFMRQQDSPHGAAVGGKIAFYSILLLTIFAALTHLGVELTGLLAAAGIFTVAIGFAAQTSVSNVISGLFLLVDRPFSINDTVKIDTTIGTIISIDLLSSKVRTFDNLVVRIPNETLLKATITNYTLFGVRRIDIPVQVAYSTDLREAQRVLGDVMRRHKAVLDEPEPVVLTELLADSGVNLLIRAWVDRTEFIQARSDLTMAVKEALEQADIEIPFPQRVVHHRYEGERPGLREEEAAAGAATDEAPAAGTQQQTAAQPQAEPTS